MQLLKGKCEQCKKEASIFMENGQEWGGPLFCPRCAFILKQRAEELFDSLQASLCEINRLKAKKTVLS